MAETPLVRPFEGLPDPREYAHLTEEERMMQGYPDRPLHQELQAKKIPVKAVLERYNRTSYNEEHIRQEILKKLLHPSVKSLRNIAIRQTFRVSYGYNLKIGNNFFANYDCCFLDSALIEFGDDCMLGPKVGLYASTHPVNGAYRLLNDEENYFELAAPIKIGDNCWLGGGCTICPGVTLGNNVVVGAGAVVTKSFPDNVVLGGNPAKVIRQMPPPQLPKEPIWKDLKQAW